MGNAPRPTRRALLKATGIAASTAVLGGIAYGATNPEDSDGSVDWFRTYSVEGGVRIQSVFEHSDGYVGTTSTHLNYYSDEGELTRSYELPDSIYASARTTDGKFLHAGERTETDERGSRHGFATVFKTDSKGNRLWKWQEESASDRSEVSFLIPAPEGGGYALGDADSDRLGIRFDADGNVVWKNLWDGRYPWSGAIPAHSGGVVTHASGDITRITADGTTAWKRTVDGWDITGLVQGLDGGYAAHVQQRDPTVFELWFYNAHGERTGRQRYTTPADDSERHVYHLTKTETSYVPFGERQVAFSDAFGMGLTPTGDQRWYFDLGPEDTPSHPGVYESGSQSVILGGKWGSQENYEYYLARISEGGSGSQPTATGTATPPDGETTPETATESDTATESASTTETVAPTGTESGDHTDGGDCEI